MRRNKWTYLIILWFGLGLAKSPTLLRYLWVMIIFGLLIIIPNIYRKRVRKNLKMFFPEIKPAQRLLLIHHNMLLALQIGVDIITVWFRGKDWAESRISKINNSELADTAMRRGKGVIFISPHLGNWEMLSPYLGEKYKCLALYKEARNPHYNRASIAFRNACGLESLAISQPMFVKKVIQKLKQGGGLTLLPDQRPQENKGSIMAEFYGVNIPSAILLSRITKITGAEIVCAFALRQANGKYEVFFQKPHPDIYADDLYTSTRAVNKSVENCIGKNIAQYNWLQNKVKHSRN